MAFPIKLSFRATSGYVTDGSGETYMLDNETYSAGSAIARAPISDTPNACYFGNSGGVYEARDRSTGVDVRLAGVGYHQNTTSYRVIGGIPSGSYDVRVAVGDAVFNLPLHIDFRDGASTSLFTITDASPGAGQFYDAMGTKHSAANWPANNVARTVSITTGELRIYALTASRDILAHIEIAEAASPSTYQKMIGSLRQVS